MACGSSLQLLIPAFRRPVVGKGPDPIWRPVAYVVSKRLNVPEPSFLKKPAQPATHIRLGDPHGPPDLLADVVKASWASCLLAAKNKAAVIHRCRADHAAVLRDTPQFRHNIRRIVQCFKHPPIENMVQRVEDGVIILPISTPVVEMTVWVPPRLRAGSEGVRRSRLFEPTRFSPAPFDCSPSPNLSVPCARQRPYQHN